MVTDWATQLINKSPMRVPYAEKTQMGFVMMRGSLLTDDRGKG